MSRWHLFVDESGRFEEGDFPSLIGGFVVRHGGFGAKEAADILGHAFDMKPASLPKVIHGKDEKGSAREEAYRTALERLGKELAERAVLAVRIVNHEGVDFGNRVATYTNMLAELCVRTLEHVSRDDEPPITLDVTYARWMVDEEQVPERAYRERLRERLTYVLVRRGRPVRAADWKIGDLRAASGRTDRCLQICDLLCNGSHDGYRKCSPEAEAALRGAFGERDFGWTVRALTERVDNLEAQGALGFALHELASAAADDLAADAKEQAARQLDALVVRLAELGPAARGTHLETLHAWVQHLAEHRGGLRLGMHAADWCVESVMKPLVERLGEDAHTLAFVYRFERLALTAANHLGDLERARRASRELERIAPALAGQWEHAPALLEGLIHQAVHATDSLEPNEAARRMKAVADYYESLASLFQAALPDVFPGEVRSDHRAQALGTGVQAESILGLDDPAHFEAARALSNEAMAEFTARSDVARQEQYRSQLESYAGDFPAARRWLAKSLNEDVADTHAALGAAISGLDGMAQGFALLHWTRVGGFAATWGDVAEVKSFWDAFKKSKLDGSAWMTELDREYPAHGIRRFVAVVDAARGEVNSAKSRLGLLRQLELEEGAHVTMELTIMAAFLEVAALVAVKDREAAQRILEGRKVRGIVDRARAVRRRVPDEVAEVAGFLDEVAELAKGTWERGELLSLARRVAD